jgi:hypothetical protein
MQTPPDAPSTATAAREISPRLANAQVMEWPPLLQSGDQRRRNENHAVYLRDRIPEIETTGAPGRAFVSALPSEMLEVFARGGARPRSTPDAVLWQSLLQAFAEPSIRFVVDGHRERQLRILEKVRAHLARNASTRVKSEVR